MPGTALNWSQRLHWLVYHMAPTVPRYTLNIFTVVPVPSGLTQERVHECLRQLLTRHESLRLRFVLNPQGESVQVIEADPRVDCRSMAVPTRDSRDPELLVAAERLITTDFDIGREVLRAGVAHVDGEPCHVVLVMHHILSDAQGLQLINWELRQLLAGRDLPPATGQTARSNWERSSTGARADRFAGEQWNRALTAMPNSFYPAGRRRPGRVVATLSGPRLAPAVTLASRRLNVTETGILLAVFGAVLLAHSGHTHGTIACFCSNRSYPQNRYLVGCVYQTVPAVLDLAGHPDLDSFIRAVSAEHLTSQRLGRYDYDRQYAEFLRATAQRGELVHSRWVTFNNVGSTSRVDADDRALREKVRASAAGAIAVQQEERGKDLELAFRAQGKEHLTLTLDVEAGVLTEEAVEGLLRGMEALITAAGLGQAVPIERLLDVAGLTPVVRDGRWERVGGSYVDLDRVEELVSCHPLVRSAAVTVQDHRLVCEVTPHDDARSEALSTRWVRLFCLDHLASRPDVIVPQEFRVVPGDGRSAPAGAAADDWPDGPEGGTIPPTAQVLADAIRGAQPGLVLRDDAYIMLGGRVDRVAEIIRRLQNAGYGGLDATHLMSFAPLSELASRLCGIGEGHDGDPSRTVRPADRPGPALAR